MLHKYQASVSVVFCEEWLRRKRSYRVGFGGLVSGKSVQKIVFLVPQRKNSRVVFFRKFSKFSKFLLGKLIFWVSILCFPNKIFEIFEIFQKNRFTLFSLRHEKHVLFCGFPLSQLEFPNMCDLFRPKIPSLTLEE